MWYHWLLLSVGIAIEWNCWEGFLNSERLRMKLKEESKDIHSVYSFQKGNHLKHAKCYFFFFFFFKSAFDLLLLLLLLSLFSHDSVWPHRQQPTRHLCPWDSPGKNTGVLRRIKIYSALIQEQQILISVETGGTWYWAQKCPKVEEGK